MNWPAFVLSLAGMLCYMLLWHAADIWLSRRVAGALRFMSSALLILTMAALAAWLVPDQSHSVQLGAAVGIVTSTLLGGLLRQRLRQP